MLLLLLTGIAIMMKTRLIWRKFFSSCEGLEFEFQQSCDFCMMARPEALLQCSFLGDPFFFAIFKGQKLINYI
jgi:hypothetical protein